MAKMVFSKPLKYLEERNAFLNRLENKREMSIQKKLQDTIDQKQR